MLSKFHLKIKPTENDDGKQVNKVFPDTFLINGFGGIELQKWVLQKESQHLKKRTIE